MFFASALDDTNLTSIRRSIFVYSALIFVVWKFSFSLQPKELLGGFIDAPDKVVISSVAIVTASAAILLYLLVRLYVARPIALAKLHQAWGLEEMTQKDGFVQAAAEIREMVEKSSTIDYPSKQFGSDTLGQIKEMETKLSSLAGKLEPSANLQSIIHQKLKQVQDAQSRLDNKLRRILEELKQPNPELEQEISKESYKPENTTRNEQGKIVIGAYSPQVDPNFVDHLEQFRTLIAEGTLDELDTSKERLHDLSEVVEKSVKDLLLAQNRFQEHVAYCESFPLAFEEKDLERLVNSMSSELVKVRDKRELEFKWFEIRLPTIVAISSILFFAVPVWCGWQDGNSGTSMNSVGEAATAFTTENH